MTQGQTDRKRVGETVRTLVMGLWLPALFLVGLLFSYLPAFHHPAPHQVAIAVSASPAATARLQHELDVAAPGGFTLRPTAGAAEARAAVLHHSAVAAYVPGGHHPLLYGAKADGAALETVIRQSFAAVVGQAGDTLAFRELVPTVPGDASGTSLLYVVLSCVVAAYFMVITMQRAVGFGRRAHVATSIGWGAVVAAVAYLAAAYVVQVIPPNPLDLLYLFLLTQAVSLTAYGLVPFFGGFFPGIAITLFVLLGVPSCGAANPAQLVPGFFRFLHPILPMGNAADALRSVSYFGNSQLLRPTAVLCAWTAGGATLVLLGHLRQQRRLAQEAADRTMTEYVPALPAEDPTVMLPDPVALAPHQHHFGDEEPILTGRVTDPSGQPLPGTTVTVMDSHGRQLVRTRTDRNGEYAATGFSDVAAVVIAITPGRPAAVAQLLLDPAAPVNQDLVLGAQLPETCEPDGSGPRGRVSPAG
ncbi:carboxypeptidase regulatory-like domain-containing protein [Streptomyces sp. NPDC056653]|uniref:carboxypeptidase regulatory-like domain-containing protein n=1 Tax=Streptomyces sp. NPDC056653 TaxID=3345894 RepID=UPI0036A9A777